MLKCGYKTLLSQGVDSYYGEEGWLTSGVEFNPYQSDLTKPEVCRVVKVNPVLGTLQL